MLEFCVLILTHLFFDGLFVSRFKLITGFFLRKNKNLKRNKLKLLAGSTLEYSFFRYILEFCIGITHVHFSRSIHSDHIIVLQKKRTQ